MHPEHELADLNSTPKTFTNKKKPKPHISFFCAGIHTSPASFLALLPITDSLFLCFKTYFVHSDVLLLIGINVLIQFCISIDFSTQSLTSKSQNWKLQLFYRHGHAYIHHTLPTFTTCYKKQEEPLKLPKQFIQRSPGKIFNILKRARPEKSNSNLQNIL